jgi:uncharacterized membrane protein YecN with MAPEG domain
MRASLGRHVQQLSLTVELHDTEVLWSVHALGAAPCGLLLHAGRVLHRTGWAKEVSD